MESGWGILLSGRALAQQPQDPSTHTHQKRKRKTMREKRREGAPEEV